MPRLSVWFIRAALACLLVGTALGSMLLAAKGTPGNVAGRVLMPPHAELLLIGWLTNLALGVAYWVLPKHATGPERGRSAPAWGAFLLVNAGVLTSVVGMMGETEALLLAGRVAELTGAVSFAAHAWPRIKRFGLGR